MWDCVASHIMKPKKADANKIIIFGMSSLGSVCLPFFVIFA